MKKLLITAILFPLWGLGSSFAQARVFPEADTLKNGVNRQLLEKYFVKTQHDSRKSEKIWEYGAKLFGQKVGKYFTDLPKGFLCVTDAYTNKAGKIDYLIYKTTEFSLSDSTQTTSNVSQETLPDSLLAVFKTRLQQFADAYHYPIGETNVVNGYFFIGKQPEEPKDARKDSTIISLREAQQTTRPDTVKTLALAYQSLENLPAEIYRFPNVEEIDLQGNLLNSVTIDVARLPKLRLLNLSKNELTDSSLHLSKNKNLKILNLQNNQFTTIRDAVRNNRGLTSLWLGYNELTNLSNQAFRKLRSLQDINFYRCGLKTLPKGVGKLKNLEVIDLYYNQLTTLPTALKKLRKLTQLAISHNELTELPQQIGRFKKLQTLHVHHNRLGNLPESTKKLQNLRVLDINHNLFNELPTSIGQLGKLEELDLSENNLSELPTGLIQLRQLQKMFLVGNPFLKDDNLLSRSRPVIKTLEGNKTEVFY